MTLRKILPSQPARFHSYKVLRDPIIHQGVKKEIRYEGLLVPRNRHHHPPLCADPRRRLNPLQWQVREDMRLPNPHLKIDEWHDMPPSSEWRGRDGDETLPWESEEGGEDIVGIALSREDPRSKQNTMQTFKITGPVFQALRN